MVIPHTFSPSRGDRVRWYAETNYGHYAPFRHPEAASPMTCGDTLWSSTPFVNREEWIRQYQDDFGRPVLIIFKIFVGSVGGEIDRPNGVPLEQI